MNMFHKQTSHEVMAFLGVTNKGLNENEIQRLRKEQGFNELTEGAKKSYIQVFFAQFQDFLVLILIGAAVISGFLGKFESMLVIVIVIVINAMLGTVQHVKAEKSLQSLKALSSPTAKVLRNGQKVQIPSREILIGDILYLDAGDYISADGRIIENYSIQIDESSLTGESVSVLKTADIITEDHTGIGDQQNMVFSGSFVTYGRAVIVVTAIGMRTEIGKIAKLLESATAKKTPLQVNLDHFGKKLAVAILTISAIIFALNQWRGHDILESFLFAVSLAVAAIPEALSSIVTIVLAIGTQKMSRENAIVRNLHAVESLGSISVICSDKTGTLTQNKMTVKTVYIDKKILGYDELNHAKILEKQLLLMALLCNDAITLENKEMGDPTEIALVNLGEVYDLDELDIRKEYPRVSEVPFDSDRKLMSTVNSFNGKTLMITKGALDVLLLRTQKMVTSNGIEVLTEDNKKEIEKVNKKFSESGLRVLAFAYKEIQEGKIIDSEDEKDLLFLGLVSMMDPPRGESAAAVADCITAGIKPVMITGDHKITASAIAKQIGILGHESEAIEGRELDLLSDEELLDKVEGISVYARVSPEHKIRIVKAWQERGNVVAMTGDGVNDAPALKQADIGIAMGITGTEVAKDAAAIVLADDNFSTIVKAISNGRSIYANIKNSIKFLLSGNTAGILSVLYASLVALPLPFAPVHLLFINLVTDSLPAIAIGLEPHNQHIMKEKPRNINLPIMNRSFAIEVIMEGFIIATGTMAAFYIGLSSGNTMAASTMAFATLCLSRLLHGFNSRSKESIIKIGIFSNRYIWIATIIGYLLLELILRYKPLMEVFEIAPLSIEQFFAVYGISLMPLISIQLYKLLFVKM